MASDQLSKLDKVYQNRPKLIRIGFPPQPPQFPQMQLQQQQLGPFQQQQQQFQPAQPYHLQFQQPPQAYGQQFQQQQYPQQPQQFQQQTQLQQFLPQSVSQPVSIPSFPQLLTTSQPFQGLKSRPQSIGSSNDLPKQAAPEIKEDGNDQYDDEVPQYSQEGSKKSASVSRSVKNNFKRMPPPPPPPPEMIQALLGFVQQAREFPNQKQTATPNTNSQQLYIPPPAPPLGALSYLPQNLLRGNTNNSRLKLSSYVYKNQNASDAPLNPKFFKMPTKQQQPETTKEKEKLYKPNTGYIAEEDADLLDKKDSAAPEQMKIVIRGQNDLINSGVTTEHDGDDEEQGGEIDELKNISPGERQYINQKYLLSESISESQYKEDVPRVFVDPKQACLIEEQKVIEKEKEENEFQKKKEVFLLKSKYKILAEVEKEKSRKLMERLLGKDLEDLEKKTQHLEMMSKLEDQEIDKQREQTKDLEKIVKDIREGRDYKTIKKVLGIDIDKPLDEIVDLEKIKADYAVEEMFKKNEKLYNDTEDMLRQCHYFVDQDGKQFDDYTKKQSDLGHSIEKFIKRTKDEYLEDEDEEYEQNAESFLAESKINENNSFAHHRNNSSLMNSKSVRFEKNGSIKSGKVQPQTQQQLEMKEFYSKLNRQVQEAQSKIDLLCKSGGLTDEEEEQEKNKEPPNYSKPTKNINNRATIGNINQRNSQNNSNNVNGRISNNTQKKNSEKKNNLNSTAQNKKDLDQTKRKVEKRK